MNYETTIRERDGHAVIARETAGTLASAEEHCTRLRSWASIQGVALAGTPFLRFEGGKLTVNLPVAKDVETNEETGVHSSILTSCKGVYVEDVSFAAVQETVAELMPGLEENWVSAGPVELHRGKEGFAKGTLVMPVRAIAVAQPATVTATTAPQPMAAPSASATPALGSQHARAS